MHYTNLQKMIAKVIGRLESWLGNKFVRDVATLSFGTLLGRLLALAALPLLTRLYAPEDFALLAIYLALVSTVAVVSCLRLEIAIPQATLDVDAAGLLTLSVITLGTIVLIATLLVLLAPHHVAILLGNKEISPFLWLVPVGIALTGSHSAFQFWATRARRFGDIGRTRIGQSATGVVTMLALGWAGVAPFGLLLGSVLSIGAGGISLAITAWRHEGLILRGLKVSSLRDTLRRFSHYPIFSTPEALFNTAGVQVPILLIAAHAGEEAGFLFLAMQVIAAPMTLLGSSISQVYMSRATEELRAGRLASFTLSIMGRLLLVGVGPLILAGALAPAIFPWVFGSAWARAGEIVVWLVPWMALQFIASPVSTIFHTVRRQKWAMYLHFGGFILRVSPLLWVIWSGSTEFIIAFVSGSCLFYIVFIALVLRAAGIKPRIAFSAFKATLPSLTPWVCAASLAIFIWP